MPSNKYFNKAQDELESKNLIMTLMKNLEKQEKGKLKQTHTYRWGIYCWNYYNEGHYTKEYKLQ